jgi:sec-independent protein translocase protein TatB
VFDLNIGKLLILAVIALVVFGPEQLPKMASQAGHALRELRRMAEGATSELREGLGPEFSNFDVNDLNPRNFVRKHLLDDDILGNQAQSSGGAAATATAAAGPLVNGMMAPDMLAPEESPPYDAEAT